MPRTIETTLYEFDELDYAGKERAREWYRNCTADDNFFAESVIDDFIKICDKLGVDTRARDVYWSGFYSGNDGASFEGSYAYRKGTAAVIKAYAPDDTELHRIADALQNVQRRNFYQLEATIRDNSRSHGMTVKVERNSPSYQDMTEDAESVIEEAMGDLAHWLYKRLESEYEYVNSDAQVDESIRCNEYTFDEDGNRHG